MIILYFALLFLDVLLNFTPLKIEVVCARITSSIVQLSLSQETVNVLRLVF